MSEQKQTNKKDRSQAGCIAEITQEYSLPSEEYLNILINILYDNSRVTSVYIFKKGKKVTFKPLNDYYCEEENEEGAVKKKCEFPIHYNIKIGKPQDLTEKIYEFAEHNSTELKEKLEALLEDKKNLVFPKEYQVTLVNTTGFHDDRRGSDNISIMLDFCERYELKDNTLSSFTEGLYRIKSHKFDTWYEMFYKAKLNIDYKKKKIVLEFQFDHGS